jgi:hypothetical protein
MERRGAGPRRGRAPPPPRHGRARVRIGRASESDEASLRELLGHYAAALAESQQHAEAEDVARLADCWQERFVKVVPAPAK